MTTSDERSNSLWQRLTEPAASIEEPAQRRQARLLASFLVFIIPLGALSGFVQLLTIPDFAPTFWSIMGGISVLSVAYIFIRTRYYRLGVIITVAIPTAVVIINVLVNPADVITFAFLIVGLLLSSMLLDIRAIIILTGVDLVLMLLLPTMRTGLAMLDLVGPLFLLFISAGLIAVAHHHRNMVEADRRARLLTTNVKLQREIDQREKTQEALSLSLEDVAHSQRLLLALSQAGQAIQRARTPDEVYQILGGEVVKLGYQAVMLIPDEDQEYFAIGHHTFPPETIHSAESLIGLSLPEFRFSLSPGSFLNRIIVEQRPAFNVIDDEYLDKGLPVSMRPMVDQILALLKVRESIAAPIMSAGKFHGLLFVIGEGLREADVSAIGVLSNQMSVALENARLYQEVQGQAQRLELILDTIPEGIVLLDANYRVQLVNPTGSSQLKVLADAEVGDIITYLGGYPISQLHDQAQVNQSRHEIAASNRQRFFELVTQPLLAEPHVAGWVIVLREVTEEREQQQYQQAQERLATVGQLAAGIAHDFNNIMAVITLYTQMVLRTPGLSPKNQTSLSTVKNQADRAAALIAQILDFSRRSIIRRGPTEMVPFLQDLVKLMQRTLPENITIRFMYEQGNYLISADPTRLQQAIMNLGVNAREAMPAGGEMRISLSQLILEPGSKLPLPGMSTGSWLKLTVADNGVGIESQHLHRVFEPFFTTRAPGQGTGLGLAQVHGIVRQHEGFIDVSSKVGSGTIFTIFLPLMLIDEKFPESRLLKSLPRQGNGETILVVEDEDNTRQAIRDMLQIFGYRVLEAPHGQAALDIFERTPAEDISLVLTDLVMPGMGGETLFSALKERTPDMKVIIMTGYPLEEAGQDLLKQGIVGWLLKPFSAEEIADVVFKALDE